MLREEVDRYTYPAYHPGILGRGNNPQVHSTTGKIPGLRFANATTVGNSLFRPFALPKAYTSTKDVFCMRERRIVNGYRRISLFNHQIQVPNVPLYEEVDVHMVLDTKKHAMQIRLWWNQQMVHQLSLPLSGFKVHL